MSARSSEVTAISIRYFRDLGIAFGPRGTVARESTSARRRRNAIGSSLSNLGTKMLSEADLWHV